MTKNYDVIQLNNHLYVVDKEAKIDNEKDYTICKASAGNLYIYKPKVFYKDLNTDPDYWKIIATTDKALGLPLLPDIEEDTGKLAKEHIKGFDIPAIDMRIGFIVGYNAAKAKKYTEDDVVKFLKFLALDHSHKYNTTKDAWDDFKLSLSPIPKQVELEIIQSGKCMKERCLGNPCDGECYVMKLTSDNYVIIKRWIYE